MLPGLSDDAAKRCVSATAAALQRQLAQTSPRSSAVVPCRAVARLDPLCARGGWLHLPRLHARHDGNVLEALRDGGVGLLSTDKSSGQEHEWSLAMLRAILPDIDEPEARQLLAQHSDTGGAGEPLPSAALVARAADSFFEGKSAKSPAKRAGSMPSPRRGSVSPDGGKLAKRQVSAPSSVAMAGPAKPKARVPRFFGVSVVNLLTADGNSSRSLPRILVYLCEYLLAREARKAEKLPTSVIDDVVSMIREPLDVALFASVRQQFNAGEFFDCQSPVCMFRLLLAFVRELPEPLIPREHHGAAVENVMEHFRSVVSELRRNPNFKLFVKGFCTREEDEVAVDTWCSLLWGPDHCDPPEHLQAVCGRVAKLVEAAALSVNHSLPEFAEFFFQLPRVNRGVLEYLGVCFVKLDLLSRRGAPPEAEDGTVGDRMPVLYALAETFAPHILKPVVWGAGASGTAGIRRKERQLMFFLTFSYFVKRKHNLMTATERASMENPLENKALDNLLFEMAAAPAKLKEAFAKAIDQEQAARVSGLRTRRSTDDSAPSRPGSRPSSRIGSPTFFDQKPTENRDIRTVMSPPVMRQMVDTVVEVQLDTEEAVISQPVDTYSDYAESGDEVSGLSPVASPVARRKIFASEPGAAVAAAAAATAAAGQAVAASTAAPAGRTRPRKRSTAPVSVVNCAWVRKCRAQGS